MTDHCFISYSGVDGLDFATRLANDLQGQHPFIKVWFDKRELSASSPEHWDDQIANAIKDCKCLVFVMTEDSTAEGSVCKDEWTWALKYKKTVITVRKDKTAEIPFRLNNRQHVDFLRSFDVGIAQLRTAISRLDSPQGVLDELKGRLADANRDLRRAGDNDKPRIESEIDELKKQIEIQQKIVDDPKAAEEQTKRNIETGLERERQPEKPVVAKTTTKFINPPPGIAPTYYQDRLIEIKQIIDFLKDDSQRLLTIVGRGGVGKTAMVCRLLKGLELGELPNGLGAMKVDGIVYLSESGSHRINFANIFYDLCKLLPDDAAQELDAAYKNPQGSTESKMRLLLEKFITGRVVLLLDNCEPLVDTETFTIRDTELDEALRLFLNGTHTAVNIVITTRVAPRALNLIQPGRQRVLTLDEGLESPYAENILREMDSDGRLGLKSAPAEALTRARDRTRGYPRALEALFAILASDRYTTLEELLAMPTPDNVVEALVGEAFNRLDTNSQKVMQALAVYNRPVAPAAVDHLLAPYLHAMDSSPILQRLANMHFARKERGRFYLHPVDREFAFDLISQGSKTKEVRQDSEELLRTNYELRFTQQVLLERAADYFRKARKPLAECISLEDLGARLAEFELRCLAGEYNTAAALLSEIDFDCLFVWGHYRLMIQMHEKLSGNITDNWLKINNIANLGLAYQHIGEVRKAIEYFEKALEFDRETEDRKGEVADLGNLGGAYATLGEVYKAIEYHNRALVIDREIGDHKGEGSDLNNLGNRYTELGDVSRSIEYYEQALVIARETGDSNGEETRLINLAQVLLLDGQIFQAIDVAKQSLSIAIDRHIPANYEHGILAEAFLFNGDLENALINAKEAQKFDEPQNNHNASKLLGIIALRQEDPSMARQSFTRAIAQADEILSKTPQYYEALDAKGLALCGLAICEGKHHIPSAVETFRAARRIAPHAGIVKRNLRLFEELVKCDPEGILKDVRKAVEGQ